MSEARWEQIKRIFNTAMERPHAERAAFLDAECGDDAELRREVESLVRAARPTQSPGAVRTGGAADALANATTAAPTSTPLTEKAGTIIGPYKLLQVIGEGGFGTVFMAEQSTPVRRRVALKIIKLGMDTKAVVARFEAERQALALMDHPHIAKVLDGGATPQTSEGGIVGGGRPYFVMEYVTGDPITAFASAHKLSVKERLNLFAQVCAAVQHAHMKGVIHRDIKPGNVLVSMTDGKPFAKVIDFGIAKATAQPLTEKTLFTEHRQLIGTPEYMSPEQAEGSADIDTRTDVYALGVLLYELLTGLTPFDGKRLRSAAYGEMQRIIKEEEPPMPSVRISRAALGIPASGTPTSRAETPTSAQVKGELDWIVMKALDKDRTRRYETPNQLAADVQRHLAGEAVVAAPPSAAYRLRKFVRRNKGPVFAGAAVAVTLLIGIAGTAWGWREATASKAALEGQVKGITRVFDGVSDAVARASQRGVFPQVHVDPFAPVKPGIDPTLARLDTMREYAVTWIDQAVKSHQELQTASERLREQTEAAEWSAYTATLFAAQSALAANDYPEARRIMERVPKGKVGWEGVLLAKLNAEIVSLKPVQEGLSPWPGREEVASPDGLLKVRNEYEQLTVIDARTGTPLSRMQWPDLTSRFRQAAFTSDSSQLEAIGGIDGLAEYRVVFNLAAIGGPAPKLNAFDTSKRGDVLTELRVAAILASSPNGPSALTLTTPDGSRIIKGFADGTVRFYEAKDGKPTLPPTPATADAPDGVLREVAVFRMPGAVSNLQMTGDGTRLIISLADGSARVWDIREPEERRKDLQREWAERVPAGEYLDTLWNAPPTERPTASLREAIINDASLTPLRQLVAVELLEERTQDAKAEAARAFGEITKDQTDPAAVQAKAQAAELPARVKEVVVAEAQVWRPSATGLNQQAWPVVASSASSPAAVTSALLQATKAAELAPANADTINTLGVAQYRAGKFEDALATLARSTALYAETGKAQPADIAFIAMAHAKLSQTKPDHADQAKAALAQLRKLMIKPEHKDDAESQGFLREAEALIEPGSKP